MAKRSETDRQLKEPAVFHIRQCREKWGIGEGRQLLFVTIPRQADLQYHSWPEELTAYLQPFFGYSASIESVADRSVIRWMEEKKLKEKWEQEWCFPQYKDYHRMEYAAYLLNRAVKGMCAGAQGQELLQMHLYVLGYESFVPEVIAPYLNQIRALTFLLPRRTWEECGLEEYREMLCEEEGLAAGLRILEEPRGYKGLRLQCFTPALVLDLSGEEKLLPDGSGRDVFWVDMDAQEPKRRKIESVSAETAYFSMKEEWRRLDTAGKNGYNT